MRGEHVLSLAMETALSRAALRPQGPSVPCAVFSTLRSIRPHCTQRSRPSLVPGGSIMRGMLCLAALVTALFAGSATAHAQMISGDLVVRVVDPSDLIVAGAT